MVSVQLRTSNDRRPPCWPTTVIADHRAGRRHDVHISLRRDGSVWVRVGNGQLDLATVNERRRRIQASVLDDSAVEALRYLLSRRQQQQHHQRLRWQAQLRQVRLNTSTSSTSSTSSFDWHPSSTTVVDRCALTDVEMSLTVAGGWNPSYVAAFDAEGGRGGGGREVDGRHGVERGGDGRHGDGRDGVGRGGGGRDGDGRDGDGQDGDGRGGGGRSNFESRIFSVRNTRDDCQTSANVYLSANKQAIRCDGGNLLPGSISVCSQRVVPERNVHVAQIGSSSGSGTLSSHGVHVQAATTMMGGGVPLTSRVAADTSPTWFIKYISMDPNGTDHWYCRQHEERNRFSLTGSYYYAYVRVATCPPPIDSRSLGDEITLRPHSDTWRNMILLPDPTKTVLSDSIIQGWQMYVKAVSIEHNIYLQVWRPMSPTGATLQSTTSTTSSAPSTIVNVTAASNQPLYSLVGQTFIEASELRFREVVLRADQFIRVSRGDILGVYFPDLNPIGWSSVPCASAAQRFAFVRAPKNVTIGSNFHFLSAAQPSIVATSIAGSGDLCRYYSFAALFANRSRSKSVEDHHCPPPSTTDQQFQSTFRGPTAGDIHASLHSPHTPSRNPLTAIRNPGIPGSRTLDAFSGSSAHRPPTERHQHDDSMGRLSTAARDLSEALAAAAAAAADGGPSSLYYALLVVACILLSMVIVGTVSYCVASRTSPPMTSHLSSNSLAHH